MARQVTLTLQLLAQGWMLASAEGERAWGLEPEGLHSARPGRLPRGFLRRAMSGMGSGGSGACCDRGVSDRGLGMMLEHGAL